MPQTKKKKKKHGRRTADAARRTDIWITKSLPELSSRETKKLNFSLVDVRLWRSCMRR